MAQKFLNSTNVSYTQKFCCKGMTEHVRVHRSIDSRQASGGDDTFNLASGKSKVAVRAGPDGRFVKGGVKVFVHGPIFDHGVVKSCGYRDGTFHVIFRYDALEQQSLDGKAVKVKVFYLQGAYLSDTKPGL